MRIALVVVGRLKDGPERELFSRYWSRLEAQGRKLALGPLTLTEIAESRASSVEARKTDEAAKLLATAPAGDLIVLDESGRSLTSTAFAADIRRRRDQGVSALTFVIGGPDGHGEALIHKASLVLSLGGMTLPHGLARVVLAEQLYRGATLIAGHPYHRS